MKTDEKVYHAERNFVDADSPHGLAAFGSFIRTRDYEGDSYDKTSRKYLEAELRFSDCSHPVTWGIDLGTGHDEVRERLSAYLLQMDRVLRQMQAFHTQLTIAAKDFEKAIPCETEEKVVDSPQELSDETGG